MPISLPPASSLHPHVHSYCFSLSESSLEETAPATGSNLTICGANRRRLDSHVLQSWEKSKNQQYFGRVIPFQLDNGNGKGLSTSLVDSTLSQMVIPPPEELLALSQAAQIGDVSEVEQEINRLQQLNPEYTSFVTKVVKLAEEFEYEEIVNLVDGYFNPDSAP